jgi:hypothetical protein
MKKQSKNFIISFLFGLFFTVGFSQDERPVSAPWASDKGYWVVQNNIQDPLNQVVRFYTNENVLIHTESLSGVKLNTRKRRMKMKLKKALEAAVSLYDQHRQPAMIRDYVVKILK